MSPHEIIAEILQFNNNGEDLPKQTLRFIREANTEDREVRRAIEQLHKKYVLMNACGSRNIEPNAVFSGGDGLEQHSEDSNFCVHRSGCFLCD